MSSLRVFVILTLSFDASFANTNGLQESALKVADRILGSEPAPCFTLSGELDTGSLIRKNLDWKSLAALERCKEFCCDYTIIFLRGLKNIVAAFKSLGHHRMYIIINTLYDENPTGKNFNLMQDNVVWLQTISGENEMFGIYEKKKGKFAQTSAWNGVNFREEPFKRTFQGETMRIASSVVYPNTEVFTDENGRVIPKGGVETIFLKSISQYDETPVVWTDIYAETGLHWGTVFSNGTSTGLLNYVVEYKTDVASLGFYCSGNYHIDIWCSTAWDYDGAVVSLPKPKPTPTWQGLITPYGKWAWLAIAGNLIVTTLVLGFCHKLSLNWKENDWPLHFLDAFHPLNGRPMGVLGFNAAHLGQDKKILPFEIFLLTYSLACLVINTGYEGNLKSHLTAITYPPNVKTLAEFTSYPFNDIVYMQPDPNWAIQELKHSAVREVRELPERKQILGRRGDFLDVFHEPLRGNALISAGVPTRYQVRRYLTRADGSEAIQTVPQHIQGFPVVLHFPRRSRFVNHVNHRMMQWLEGGFFSYHMKWELLKIKDKNWVPFYDPDYVAEGTTWAPLVLDHFRLLFGVYGGGMVISIIIFVPEKYLLFKTKTAPSS